MSDEMLADVVLAVVRLYEQTPDGEGLDGALWRAEIAAKAVLGGAAVDDAVREALAAPGYGVPPSEWQWVRIKP